MSTSKTPPHLNPENVRTGATIRHLREKSGLRIGQLADVLNPPRSYSYLSNIEAGRKPLTPALLRQIADVLGVPPIAIARPDLFPLDDHTPVAS